MLHENAVVYFVITAFVAPFEYILRTESPTSHPTPISGIPELPGPIVELNTGAVELLVNPQNI